MPRSSFLSKTSGGSSGDVCFSYLQLIHGVQLNACLGHVDQRVRANQCFRPRANRDLKASYKHHCSCLLWKKAHSHALYPNPSRSCHEAVQASCFLRCRLHQLSNVLGVEELLLNF